MGVRNVREMRTVGECLDALLRGELDHLADLDAEAEGDRAGDQGRPLAGSSASRAVRRPGPGLGSPGG
eukprot:1584793-Pyramimonas_sp.AAC.1